MKLAKQTNMRPKKKKSTKTPMSAGHLLLGMGWPLSAAYQPCETDYSLANGCALEIAS